MTERDAFEAWMRDTHGPGVNLVRSDDGYISTVPHRAVRMTYASVQMLWEAWQARAQPAQAELALIRETPQEAVDRLLAKLQPAQAVPLLSDDEIALIVADCAASAHRQDDFSFARAVEDAVRAKMGVAVPQWLPIETAPKGQRVMVWIADKEAGENIAFAKVWFHADGTLGGGAEGFNGKWDLTHWMPLPPPPIAGKEGGNVLE